MRDKTGTAAFLRHKGIERTLHTWLPRWYTPLYTLVSFTRTPYADAVRKAARQDRIVHRAFQVVITVLILAALFFIVRPLACR